MRGLSQLGSTHCQSHLHSPAARAASSATANSCSASAIASSPRHSSCHAITKCNSGLDYPLWLSVCYGSVRYQRQHRLKGACRVLKWPVSTATWR